MLAFCITKFLFLTKLFSAFNLFSGKIFVRDLGNMLFDEYALSQSLLLTHSLLLIFKLVISINKMDKDSKIISKNCKNSEYSITFGGIAKFKPYKTDFL